MGASNTHQPSQLLKISNEQWQYFMSPTGQQLAKNRESGLQGQVTLVAADPLHQAQDQFQIYWYRKQQDKALVKVFCAQFLSSTEASMCGNQRNVKVIYERMNYRLRDCPLLTFQQFLYVLCEALRGFGECYTKVGEFQVTDGMIGINSKGFIKVWLNENFGENHPQTERPSLQIVASSYNKRTSQKQQANFVRNIVEVIKQKVNKLSIPKDFQKILNQSHGFSQKYAQLEQYCQQNTIWIPDRIIIEPTGRSREAIIIQQSAVNQTGQFSTSHANYLPYSIYQPQIVRQTYVTKSIPQSRTHLNSNNSRFVPFSSQISHQKVQYKPFNHPSNEQIVKNNYSQIPLYK